MFSFCITGHRPASLFKGMKVNYDIHSDAYIYLRKKILVAVMNLISATKETEIHAYTGMALGVDQIFAEICFGIKEKLSAKGIALKVIAVIPCKDQERSWSKESRELYKKILSQCDESIVLAEKYTSACMQDRNVYMVDHSDAVIAVYDGKKSGTGNCVEYAKKSGKEVTIVSPEMKAQEVKEEKIMTNIANNNSVINKNYAIYVAVNQSTNYSDKAIKVLIGVVSSEIELAKKGGAKNVYIMSPLKNKAEKEVVKALKETEDVYPIGIFWKGQKTTPEIASLVAWAHYEPKNENAWGVNHSNVVVAMGREVINGRNGNGYYAAKFAKENRVRCAQVVFLKDGGSKVVITEGKTIGVLTRKDIEKVNDHNGVTPVKKDATPKATVFKKAVAPKVTSVPQQEVTLGFNLKKGQSSDYYAQVIKKANALLAEARRLKKEAKEVEKAAKEAEKAAKKSAPKKAVTPKTKVVAPKKSQPEKEVKKTTKKVETKKEVKIERPVVKEVTPKITVPVQTTLELLPETKEVIVPEVKQEVKKEVERPVQKEVKKTTSEERPAESKKETTKDVTPTGEALPTANSKNDDASSKDVMNMSTDELLNRGFSYSYLG